MSSSLEEPSRPMARFLASFSAAAVSTRFLIFRPLAVRNSRSPLYSLRSIDVNVCSLPSPARAAGVARRRDARAGRKRSRRWRLREPAPPRRRRRDDAVDAAATPSTRPREQGRGSRRHVEIRKGRRDRPRVLILRSKFFVAEDCPYPVNLSNSTALISSNFMMRVGLWMKAKERSRGYNWPVDALTEHDTACLPSELLNLPVVKTFLPDSTLKTRATN